jgi:hypothetical protein|tara:strand:- start:12 stop:461 length:450 start_codon:yes stop_codon:yes gene_type:complete
MTNINNLTDVDGADVVDMSREAFEINTISGVEYSITSSNILTDDQTGRVVAVFYDEYDLAHVISAKSEMTQLRAALDQAAAVADSDRIMLLQYESLRVNFHLMVSNLLGKDYYNMGMDVYECDRICCEDITNKSSLSWLRKLIQKEPKP